METTEEDISHIAINGGKDYTDNTNGREKEKTKEKQQDNEEFGDKIGEKNDNELRLLHININGIPMTKEDRKNDQIFQVLARNKIDIVGLTEINRYWPKMNEKDRWRQRTQGWWETSKTTMAYNTKDSTNSTFQPGGTMITSIGKPAHRIDETGNDETGLGRWTWQKMKGKRNIRLRIISAYRPCIPSTAGPTTAYSQQQRYLNIINDKRDPRQAFLEDLGKNIEKWHNDGDQIILMADLNTDVTNKEITLWRERHRLKDVYISEFPNIKIPATYHKGKNTIDTIMVSHSIKIEKAGFLAFGDIPSDHRGLWLDVTYQTAFGHNMQKLIKPQARRLKSNNPIVRNNWIKLYKLFIKNNNLDEQLIQLESEIIPGEDMTENQQQRYNKILQIRHEGIRFADKRCRKLKMGGVPFSPEVKKTGQRIEFWKGVITKKRGAKYSMTKLRRLAIKIGAEKNITCNMETAEDNLKKAEQEYSKAKKNAQEIRRKFMTEQINAMANETGIKIETIRKQLYEREQQRITSRNIKYTLKKIQGGGVTRVEVPRGDNKVEIVTTKEEIERECMIENEKKYRQTSNTPCMQGQLQRDLQYDALTEAGKEILRGEYNAPQGTDQYTKELLSQLKTIPYQYDRPPEAHISQKTYKEGWKKMKEATSAGISGLHFGHMKATTFDEGLIEFESAISSIPFTTGYSPPKWQYGVMVMLQKKAKVDLVDQMRTIVLTEADFNFNNKILGRLTLQKAETAKAIPKEQYGSRKGHSAIDHAINKRLLYDILRQTRRPGALCSNDAKSCFDRVVHSIAMLAYQRLGIPSPPVKSMLHTIQKMKHHIRTTYGDSEFTMHSEEMAEPYQGLLQGNGASPATWVIISAPLINMMREAQNGAFLTEAISNKIHHTAGFAFVDDTDLIEADLREGGITIEKTLDKMQQAINRWEGGLKATGGAIRPDKSWAYPIGFKFDSKGKWRYQKLEEIETNLTVKDENENEQSLNMIPPDRGKETLGVFLAPDGSNTETMIELTKKATQWADYIRTGHLNRDEAKTAVNTTIMKSLQYPLPALTLNKEQCRSIQRIVINAGLPNGGTCRNYPRAALFGPKNEGGLGMDDLYRYQGTSRIAIIQEHLHTTTITGEMLRTSIEAAKIEIGIGRNIFELEYKKFGILLTECWIKDVWKFADENGITIKEEVTNNVEFEREGDVFLMEEIVHSNKFKPSELQKINRCRIHLQVMLLSEITDGYGEKFTMAYTCHKNKSRQSPFLWPIQPRPENTIIRWWKKAIKACFLKENTQELNQPMGRWLRFQSKEKWQWYYINQSKTIYQKHNDRWKIWNRTSKAGRLGKYPTFSFRSYGIQLPREAQRATVQIQHDSLIQLTGWCHSLPEILQNNAEEIEDQEGFITETQLNKEEIDILKEAMHNGDMKIVSDGSYRKDERYSTAGWITEDRRRQINLKGSLITPGSEESHCSHRSELSGILGAIININHLCNKHDIKHGSIELGCDGEGAIKIMEQNNKIIKSNRKHFDLIQAIQNAKDKSPLQWKFRHIKGHQDEVKEYTDLNRWEQLNVQADIIAKERMYLETYNKTENELYRPQHVPYLSCQIQWQDRQGRIHHITTHLQNTLKQAIGSTTIREYWIKKRKFSSYTERWIDWDHLQKSINGLKRNRQQWLSKWLTGFCGVGVKMQIYRSQYHSKCPRCLCDNETTNHVMKCPHPTAIDIWKEQIDQLEVWMTDQDAQPEMAKTILTSLQAWHDNTPFPTIRTNNAKLKEATRQQDRIGWRSFTDGFLSDHWKQCQKDHMEARHSQKSPALWMAKLQRKIWAIPWELWDSRNKILHEENNTVHAQEEKELLHNIDIEWKRGLDGLPSRYQRLFRETLQHRKQESIIQQKQWLTSVWAARGSVYQDGSLSSGNIAMPFFDKWRCENCPPTTEVTHNHTS